jgi:hypothetical protein
MKIRPIKYEFASMRKEAHEATQDEVVASVRIKVGKVLNLFRPLLIKNMILKTVQPNLKNDY